jgi:small subunit ribosomal protein S16
MLIVNNRKIRQKVIRLRKIGKIYYPVYEIILIYKDKRNRSSFIEKLGFFNPNIEKRIFFINTYRLSYWLNKGVQINNNVKKYLVKFLVI